MSQPIGSGPNHSIVSQNSLQESQSEVDKTMGTKEPVALDSRKVSIPHRIMCAIGAAISCKDSEVQYNNFYNQCTGLGKNLNAYQKK